MGALGVTDYLVLQGSIVTAAPPAHVHSVLLGVVSWSCFQEETTPKWVDN